METKLLLLQYHFNHNNDFSWKFLNLIIFNQSFFLQNQHNILKICFIHSTQIKNKLKINKK